MNLTFPEIYEKRYTKISDEKNGLTAVIDFPAVVQILGGRAFKVRYQSVEECAGQYIAKAEFAVGKDVQFLLQDIWREEEEKVRLDRNVRCLRGEQAIRITTEMKLCDKKAVSFDDYQIVVPGSFYNKNDIDLDGKEDYLGTFNQDYKDDRNPGLCETVWCKNSGNYLALIRADVPKLDESFTREQIEARHFIHNTDIGSLGFAPSVERTNEMVLRCDYPFYERNSFCLNVDTSEWSAYKAMKSGEEFRVSYLIVNGCAESLTEASWNISKLQMDRILNDNIQLKFTLQESMDCRRELTHNSYREFPEKDGKPAGYFVHFSPRSGYGKQNILEYGFSGQQQMLAYVMLVAAKDLRSEEHRRRAVNTIEFFIRKCIHKSGIPYGLYDADKEDFIFWWTGVLFPFQYSRDRKELENYLGSQVVSAIIPIAKELEKNDGNYTRTMIEAMYYLWLCYEEERSIGVEHEDWKQVVIAFCNKFVELQNPNGSWNRAYTMEGQPLVTPKEWFGSNELEQGSGVIFPVEVLAKVYEENGDERYLKAAVKAADFICNTYVEGILYAGGLNDTTHKKSIKEDAVGVMFAMRSLLLVYEMTKDEKYLNGAADAAKVLASWTYLWDIPFDKNTLLGRHGFGTTGWTGCDVIPACSYVDDEFAEFIPDLLKIVEYCRDPYLARLGKIVFLGMQHGLSTHTDMYEYQMAGVQCEGFLTSLWLSDTENPEFSGAVAKMKGDDNDTCNGLINGQQLATMHHLIQRYGTMDMEQIMRQILG